MSAIRLNTLCECGSTFEDHYPDRDGVMNNAMIGCSHFKAVEMEESIYQDPRPCKTCGYPRSHHGNVGGLEVPFYHVYAPEGDAPSDADLKILDTLTDAQLDAYLKGRVIRQKVATEHSPFPWKAKPGHGLVYDADGVIVADAVDRCRPSELGENNARILSCAGDGVELARVCLQEEILGFLPQLMRGALSDMAKGLILKAGV